MAPSITAIALTSTSSNQYLCNFPCIDTHQIPRDTRDFEEILDRVASSYYSHLRTLLISTVTSISCFGFLVV